MTLSPPRPSDIRSGAGRKRSRRGVALLFVLSILMILTVIATGFAAFTTADMKASQATYQETETYFLAEAGLDYGMYMLKHNMLVYPAPPAQWLDGRTIGNEYDVTQTTNNPVANGMPIGKTGTAFEPGYISNLAYDDSVSGREIVVVENLAYTAANDWLASSSEVGSFRVSEKPIFNASTYSFLFTSIGYLKQLPGGFSGDYSGIGNFTVLAQRTLQCKVTLNAGAVATGSSSSVWNPAVGPIPIPNDNLEVSTFNEKFR